MVAVTEKRSYDIIMMNTDGVEKIIRSTKFYLILVSKNLRNIKTIFEAKRLLLAGEVVMGSEIGLPGLTFRKAD